MKVQRPAIITSKIALLALALTSLVGCATERNSTRQIVSTKTPFKIGDAVVTAEVFRCGKRPSSAVGLLQRVDAPTMINVHENESTSVAAGKVIVAQFGGRLIKLSHGGKRIVRFGLNGQNYAFDPNRIFSDAGIRRTLEMQSGYSKAAHRAVKTFATEYLAHFALGREPAIIALHNNGNDAFSIQIYLPGGEHADAAASVHVSQRRNPHDFFYVTDPRFFDYLKQKDFNVVLQDNDGVPDDGSLSIFFAHKKIPYLNIEAGMDHLNAQTEMVRAAREMLDKLGLVK